MTVNKVIINSFKGISKIETSLKDGVFWVCGMNESGKSSFLDALVFALLGRKAFPMGEWKKIISTSGAKTLTSCELVDDDGNTVITITRKVTKSGNESATIVRADGKSFKQSDLNMLLEPISLNPKTFMDMTPKEQALFLGVDTSELDAEYKEIYQERQFIGRDVKRLEGAKSESYCEKPVGSDVDIEELYEKQHMSAMNGVSIENNKERILILEGVIKKARQEMANLKKAIENTFVEDGEAIEAEIEKAKASQGLVQQYNTYLKVSEELETATTGYEGKSNELQAIKAKKTQVIVDSKLPFPNMTINEDGELVIIKEGKEMPLNSNFFSTGKMWEMAIRIIAAKNPELKTVIVKDATLLDKEKIDHITKVANKKGLQVLMEFVGEAQGENSITLVEGELDVV